MRLIHMTDVHFLRRSSVLGLVGKRGLGLANLYLGGRRHHFQADAVVSGAVTDALDHKPDLFVMTGDMSALSNDAEFDAAREAFAPLLESVPSVVVPGNHDRYTLGAVRTRAMERVFGPWMGGGRWGGDRWEGRPDEVSFPARFRLSGVDVITADPCQPGLNASGRSGEDQLAALGDLMRESRQDGQGVVLAQHYPVWHSNGDA